VIEQTHRGERGWDLYSRLLKDRIVFLGNRDRRQHRQRGDRPAAVPRLGGPQARHHAVRQLAGRRCGGRSGDLRHDAVSALRRRDVLHGAGGVDGQLPARDRHQGQAVRAAALARDDPPAARRVSGPATDIEIHAREILHARDTLNELYAKHTGQPASRIKQDTERDNFMSAADARDYGLIDEVLTR